LNHNLTDGRLRNRKRISHKKSSQTHLENASEAAAATFDDAKQAACAAVVAGAVVVAAAAADDLTGARTVSAALNFRSAAASSSDCSRWAKLIIVQSTSGSEARWISCWLGLGRQSLVDFRRLRIDH
jgi:hypothetical protein